MRKIFSAFLLVIFAICLCLYSSVDTYAVKADNYSDGNDSSFFGGLFSGKLFGKSDSNDPAVKAVRDGYFNGETLLTVGELLEEKLGPVTWSKKDSGTAVYAKIDMHKKLLDTTERLINDFILISEIAAKERPLKELPFMMYFNVNAVEQLVIFQTKGKIALEFWLKRLNFCKNYLKKYKYVNFEFHAIGSILELNNSYIINPKTDKKFYFNYSIDRLFKDDTQEDAQSGILLTILSLYKEKE